MCIRDSFLIAMRALMGVGAALVMPSTLSLVMMAFPPQERAKAIAVWVGFAGAGGSLGPIMGGFLLTHFWWGSVFFVPVVLAVATLIACSVVAPKAREPGRPRLDPAGALLSVIGLSSFLFAIIEGPEKGWTDAVVIGAFAVALLGIGGFVVWERRTATPMLDIKYFGNRRFAAGTVGITLAFLAMFAMFFVLTQYLQYVLGYSPLKAGFAGLPVAVSLIVVSPRSIRLSARIGIKRMVVAGMLTIAIGLTLLSLVGLSTAYLYIALALVVTGCGMAVTTPALSAAIVTALPMHKAGVASAVNDTTRELGGAMGIAIVGGIVTSAYRDQLAPTLAGLPGEAAEQAGKNVGRATRVAEELAAQGGDGTFLDAVRGAFVDGARVGLRVAAVLILLGAVYIARQFPSDDPVPAASAAG